MNYKLKIKKSENAGYTAVETIIALSLFIIVIMIGMGALLNANLLHQKSQNMRSILDNLNFIMEDMSKNLKTGYKYHCITGDDDLLNVSIAKSGSNCWGIAFEYQNGSALDPNDQWVYEIVTPDDGVTYYIRKSIDSGATWTQLTPEEIIIDSAASGLSVLGAESPSAAPPNYQQPLVTINLVGKIVYKDTMSPFSLQTSVSQRMIDI